MPKRTRREKIIADARRIIRQNTETALPTPQAVYENPLPRKQEYSFRGQKITVAQAPAYDYSLIRKDIMRTVFLGAAGIAAELVIFFWLGSRQ
ncbi:hypothetical protein A2Z33_07150 [Candidatus Gottesmanbacteria bacterium RBG_16_52_11]|uniref:Uncharacterized protein n=1 Tax=Candidatus Gottesmanbacteria bacterium RBG_16_52_11 TaxID=1798374 RepID=A0A1F5YXX5_9BACT|nr:MAG: hypothetical protein A2Z33_07150 [Candidatus Gottesmanbacteria bacterium RBG_16_52_11]